MPPCTRNDRHQPPPKDTRSSTSSILILPNRTSRLLSSMSLHRHVLRSSLFSPILLRHLSMRVYEQQSRGYQRKERPLRPVQLTVQVQHHTSNQCSYRIRGDELLHEPHVVEQHGCRPHRIGETLNKPSAHVFIRAEFGTPRELLCP